MQSLKVNGEGNDKQNVVKALKTKKENTRNWNCESFQRK